MKFTKTDRGFAVGRFLDRYGRVCRIQESSLATEDCIWLGPNGDCMHLTQDMAAELMKLLAFFVENGELPDETQEYQL